MRKSIIVIPILIGIASLVLPIIPIDETYEIYETYTRPLRYKVISSKCKEETDISSLRTRYISEVILKNTDEYAGKFTVTHYYATDYKNVVQEQSRYLEPEQNETFRISFTYGWTQHVSGNIKDIKSDTKVQDSRLVTKHRTHYKSVIGILLENM